jgi:hypothetical protein
MKHEYYYRSSLFTTKSVVVHLWWLLTLIAELSRQNSQKTLGAVVVLRDGLACPT